MLGFRSFLTPRRVLVTALVAVVVAAIPSAAENSAPADPTGWAFNGAAQPTAAGVRLVAAGQPGTAGSMFSTTVVALTAPLRIGFDATIGGGSEPGADGVALVLANARAVSAPDALGGTGSGLGYTGIPGVAVALDTYRNIGEPSDNFIGIANGATATATPRYIATTAAIPDLRAGTHAYEVDVSTNHLDVAIDGQRVLSLPVALPDLALVGVTGANGAFTDNHVVTNLRAINAAGVDVLGATASPPAAPVTCLGTAMTRGQADIDAAPAGTTFCLSGTHNWDLTPKSGDRLIGPAVLDGNHATHYAIEPARATDVVLSNLEIRNYAPGNQLSAIMSNQSASGWTLDNLLVHDNGSSAGGNGASLGPNARVLGGRYYNNRQLGLADALGPGAVINGAEIDHNNFTDDTYVAANISCGFEAGGVKWTADDITVTNSNVHDNACVGLWSDVNADGITIMNNRVADNWAEGVFIEISHDATITGNTVSGNGFRSFRGACKSIWLYGGGITLASSDHVMVASNTVSANCNGITGTQELRTDGFPGLLENISVHDNTVAGPGGKTGVAAFPVSLANLLTRGITFAGNAVGGGNAYCGLAC